MLYLPAPGRHEFFSIIKDQELVELHAIEEVEGAKGKLTGGLVKVDYATGKVGAVLSCCCAVPECAPKLRVLFFVPQRVCIDTWAASI